MDRSQLDTFDLSISLGPPKAPQGALVSLVAKAKATVPDLKVLWDEIEPQIMAKPELAGLVVPAGGRNVTLGLDSREIRATIKLRDPAAPAAPTRSVLVSARPAPAQAPAAVSLIPPKPPALEAPATLEPAPVLAAAPAPPAPPPPASS